MKKILILTNNSSGLYNFRIELIEELIRQGYQVFFSVPESKNDLKVRLLISTGARHIQTHINRRGINPIEDLKLLKDYRRIIKEVNPDLVLTYTIKPNLYGTYAASNFDKPVIINITGLGTTFNRAKLRYFVTKLYRYACKKAKFIFFQNSSNYSFFINNKIVVPNKALLIPGSGVNIDRFIPTNKSKDDNKIKFLFIGRLMKEKGIEEYLEVANRLSIKYTNIEFQILGRFEEDKYRLVLDANNNEKIVYLGISNDVRKEISEVDCIVNPSYHEGMSNVLLEGAAMGKPLIASNIPGCKEIIKEGYNGYLFESGSADSLENKIIQFIELSQSEKAIMGLNSRKIVEREFDRKIVINAYLQEINRIMEENK